MLPEWLNSIFSRKGVKLRRADTDSQSQSILLIGDTMALILPQLFQDRVEAGQFRAE